MISWSQEATRELCPVATPHATHERMDQRVRAACDHDRRTTRTSRYGETHFVLSLVLLMPKLMSSAPPQEVGAGAGIEEPGTVDGETRHGKSV